MSISDQGSPEFASTSPLPPYALELSFFLLVHELTGLLAALGPVLLAHHLGLELGTFADGTLAGVVTDGTAITQSPANARTKHRRAESSDEPGKSLRNAPADTAPPTRLPPLGSYLSLHVVAAFA
jgi:hypothetical protein